jgi:tRNA pseudouridine13 synthase
MIIKHQPTDFIVEEIPAQEWLESGPFAVLKLTKTSLNTEQAISIISRRFQINGSLIKYSGTKDKHAHTIQYISIPFRNFNENKNRINFDEPNLKLEHVGFSSEPLSLGTSKGNSFKLTIKEISEEEKSRFETQVKSYDKLSQSLFVPNYFDEQRFSSSNYNIGLSILKKDYKKAVALLCASSELFTNDVNKYLESHPNDNVGALKVVPKKILLMFIHAVQSYLFNEALSKILIEHAIKNNIQHHTVEYSIDSENTRKLTFYDNNTDYHNSNSELNNSDMPRSLELIGFNSSDMHPKLRDGLDELRLGVRDFVIRAIPDLSVDGTTRECLIEVEDFKYCEIDTNTIQLEFSLPKGSYATIVVKSLFK